MSVFFEEYKNIIFTLSGVTFSAFLSFLIKKYFDKQHKNLRNFEIINKYFTSDNIDKFRNESNIIKDMMCNTLECFRGVSFEQVVRLLKNKKIGLNDLTYIIALYREGYLNDFYALNKDYKNRMNPYLVSLLSIIIFLIYFVLLIIFIAYFDFYSNKFVYYSSLILFLGIPEVIVLKYIDSLFLLKRQIKWFKENEARLKPDLISLN
ncbi:hypothetical protein GVX76_04360 [[Haemophilus] felis]|nr:hypothetical protein [[Haemophilus] felis]